MDQCRLVPLAEKPFANFKIGIRKVDVHGHIEIKANFYSVPHTLIGQKVIVHYNTQYIKVFHNEQMLVRHRPFLTKGRRHTSPEHVPDYIPLSREQAEGWQVSKAKSIGPSTHQVVYRIITSENPLSIRQSRGVLSLAKKYSPLILEEACRQALDYQNYRYRNVKQLCEQLRSQKNKQITRTITQEDDLIRPLEEYETFLNERRT